MYKIIQSKTPRDQDYPERYYNLMLYNKILNGSLYDCFKHGYHAEYQGTQARPEYIPEVERAPCVNQGLNMLRSVVEQSVGFLYGEDRFPGFAIDDEGTKQFVEDVIKDTCLVHVMQDCVTKGSIGSVAIQLKVLNSRFFPTVLETIFLTPTFDPQRPDSLTLVVDKRKVIGRDLSLAGYSIADDDLDVIFWFQRQWDDQEETWFHPWKVGAEKEDKFRMRRDEERSVIHRLGFVPIVWIRNLVGAESEIDGRCTFEPAIESAIQIDYAISRADKALKYNSDPLTVMKVRNPNQMQDFVRSDGNALVVGVEGDVKILETSGDAAHAILDMVREMRDEAMAAIHGSRANPDKLATSNSSVAQRMLYLPMVQLASHLRVQYGDMGVVPLLKMMIAIAAKEPIKVLGKVAKAPNPSAQIVLTWNDFFPPTPFDVQLQAQSLLTLVQGGIVSKKTALSNMRKYIDFGDLDDEMAQIKIEQEADAQREIDTQTEIMKAKPAPMGGARKPGQDKSSFSSSSKSK